jgi:hypothetical protein
MLSKKNKINENDNINIKNFIPGFTMGIVRAIISHPFEILKLKSQMNITKNNFYKNLFKGLHLSVLSNSIERGIQFGLFEKFKKNDNVLIASLKSSVLSTSISLPYNIILLRKYILTSSILIPKQIFYKSIGLEYIRNFSGSNIFLTSYNYFKNENIPIILRAPLSSCIVWLITYPIDSYKNLLLANNNKINIKNLYKGIQYPLIRSIPSSIIGFYVYEYMLKLVKI